MSKFHDMKYVVPGMELYKYAVKRLEEYEQALILNERIKVFPRYKNAMELHRKVVRWERFIRLRHLPSRTYTANT
jgi:hypothetical protein